MAVDGGVGVTPSWPSAERMKRDAAQTWFPLPAAGTEAAEKHLAPSPKARLCVAETGTEP